MLMNAVVCQNQYRLTKQSFQELIEDQREHEYVVTDEVWERVAGEILGRMDNFVENLLTELVHDVIDGDYDE
jgi:hypothetical protein